MEEGQRTRRRCLCVHVVHASPSTSFAVHEPVRQKSLSARGHSWPLWYLCLSLERIQMSLTPFKVSNRTCTCL